MTDNAFGRRWLLLVVAFLPFVALWSLANPLFASPDETTHMVRAQSISAGKFDSPFVTDGLPIRAAECIAFQSEVSAACQDLTWDPAGTEYELPTENYPPFFHAVAALPALITSGIWGAYVMRLWLAILCVVLLAWAGALTTRPGDSPWLLTGLCLAVVPMGVFTMSTVNPSGLGTAFTALLVAGLLSLRTTRAGAPEVLGAISVGLIGMALVRRDGVIWVLAIALVFAPGLIRQFRPSRDWIPRGRRAVMSLAAITVVVYMSFWFAGPTIAAFLRNRQEAGGTNPWEAARYIRFYLTQLVGTFGWLDSPMGEEAFLVAMIVAGFIVILGLGGTDRLAAASTAIALALLLTAPVAFGMIRFPYLQGRYLLPIWVCLMLVAAKSAALGGLDPAQSRRLTRLLLGCWLVVHMVGFLQNLRRYAVGRSGSWGSILGAEWHPPMMPNWVVVALLLGCSICMIAVIGRLLEQLEPSAPILADDSEAAADTTPEGHHLSMYGSSEIGTPTKMMPIENSDAAES